MNPEQGKKRKKSREYGLSLKPVILMIALTLASALADFYVHSDAHSFSLMTALHYLFLLGTIGCALWIIIQNIAASERFEALLSANKEAQALLENRLMAIEASQEGLAIINPFSQLTYMNNALYNIYGIPMEAEDQFIGENWLRLFPEDQAEFVSEQALQAIEQQGFWAGPVELTLDGGAVQKLDIALSRLPDGGMICTTRDVTERHKNEKEKKQLEEQFFQAQKMEAVGRLAGGIAHDFNNILAAISGYAEFLEEDLEESPSQQTFAKNILKAGREAKALVDQMLAFSRRKDSAMEPVDVVQSLQETVSILNASLPKSIEINTDYQVPQAVIKGNASQIMQVFMNLCVNARDAIDGERGEIEIIATIKDSSFFPKPEAIVQDLPDPREQPPTWIDDIDAGVTRLVLGTVARDRAYALLEIIDSGSGMSRIVMEHIFEPFFTTKPVNKGTGLGMATVHGVVIGHQGAMVIESILGKGTVFQLYFPVERGAVVSVSPERKKKGTGEIKDTGKKLLLVEDQDSVRDMMINMLSRMGYTVSSCPSGLDALETLRGNPGGFDLVITDENMPKMSGTELVHQVHFEFPKIPFILLTGYTRQQLEDMAMDHPAIKAVLKKPVTKEILSQQIESVLKTATGKDATSNATQ